VTSPIRILLLEDDAADAELVRELLEADRLICTITRTQNHPEFLAALEGGNIDIILADYKLPSFDGLSALALAQEKCPGPPFIFVSGTMGEELAIEALKQGAADYVLKTRLARLAPAVRRAMREFAERSQRKKAEEALRALENELARVGRITTLGQLAASIAHELKQPLTAIVTGARAAGQWLDQKSPNLPEAQHALGGIIKCANRATEIIDNIRAMAREAPVRMIELDINEVTLEVLDLIHAEVVRNRVTVRSELESGLQPVRADRIELQQVLLNLVMNAIEAMSASDQRNLLITSTKDNSSVRVSVFDSGPGLEPEAVDRIFQPLYTTKPAGMGMGLAICRSLLDRMGGRLSCRANTPCGAVFEFTVPIAQAKT
jgi:C4-dicarboxylate-specific signal transduction histidine kinase